MPPEEFLLVLGLAVLVIQGTELAISGGVLHGCLLYTSLQREANRVFGYTAKQTLDYAQSLYEKKQIGRAHV